jgi:hypothetical protein
MTVSWYAGKTIILAISIIHIQGRGRFGLVCSFIVLVSISWKRFLTGKGNLQWVSFLVFQVLDY